MVWCSCSHSTLSDRQGISQSASQRRKVGFREWRNGTLAPLSISSRHRVWFQVQSAGHSRPLTVQSQASSLRRCLGSEVELAAGSLNLPFWPFCFLFFVPLHLWLKPYLYSLNPRYCEASKPKPHASTFTQPSLPASCTGGILHSLRGHF